MKAATKAKKQEIYDTFKLRGMLEFVLKDARTGEIVKRGKHHNVVTCAGRGGALQRLVSSSATSLLTAIAVGSTTTAPTTNDTGLGAWATARTFGAGNTTITSATNTACTFAAAASWASNETWTNSSQIGEFALIWGTTSSAYTAFNHITTASFINFATSNTLAVTVSITN